MFEFRGGIQVYSTFVLRALAELHPDWRIDVFLLHDRAGAADFPPNVRFHCSGAWPGPLRKLSFAASALVAAALRKPELILSTHLHFGPLAEKLRGLFGSRYWLVAHGVEAWNVKNGCVAAALRNADRVVAVSEFTRARLGSQPGVSAERLTTLANTFEESRFQPGPKPSYLLKRYGFSAEDKIILSVCRLDAEEGHKGYDRILEILPALSQKIPGTRYLLVGTGSDRERLESLARREGLRGVVTLAGFVPDAELCDHYNLCDVFALPSTGEGFGIVFLEALACGRPVIAGNADASGEPLGQGELGVLVDPLDRDALLSALEAVLSGTHPNALLAKPELLQEKVVERYGARAFRARLEEVVSRQ